MDKFITLLKNRFFAPVAPERLAVIRMATGLFCLWYLLSRFDMLQRMVGNSYAFEPVGILSFMKSPLDTDVFWWLSILLIGLNLCYIMGLKFKFTGPAFAVLVLLFFTYRNSWSMIYHNRNALVLHILIVGFVAAADAWSVDAWRSKRRGKLPKQAEWHYGWPIMLICAVTVGSYFLSGIAKVAGELALEWASGNAMRSQIAVDAIRKSVLGAETSPFFNLIYKHTWLFFGMGIFTFIVELGAPLALYKSRWGKIWSLLTLGMHWGIFAIMGIRFRYQMTGMIFLSFFEPEKWLSKAYNKITANNENPAKVETAEAPVILFDGTCNLCNGWVRFVLNNERNPKFRFASLQSSRAEKLLQPFNLPRAMDSVVLIAEGQLYQKSNAVLHILSNLRFPWPLFGFFTLIPRAFRDRIYDWVARNRYIWFGKRNNCEFMPKEEQLRFIDRF